MRNNSAIKCILFVLFTPIHNFPLLNSKVSPLVVNVAWLMDKNSKFEDLNENPFNWWYRAQENLSWTVGIHKYINLLSIFWVYNMVTHVEIFWEKPACILKVLDVGVDGPYCPQMLCRRDIEEQLVAWKTRDNTKNCGNMVVWSSNHKTKKSNDSSVFHQLFVNFMYWLSCWYKLQKQWKNVLYFVPK